MDVKTDFELFEEWADGTLLDGTKDHHAMDAISRFKMFLMNVKLQQRESKAA